MQFFWTYFATVLLIFVGSFLILIVLLQRGRGGGLAGAFGGLGGQSAFGTKAGDVFTKITVVVTVIWVALAAGTSFVMRGEAQGRFQGGSQAAPEEPGVGNTEEQPTKEGQPADTKTSQKGAGDTQTESKAKPAPTESKTKGTGTLPANKSGTPDQQK